MFRLPALQRLWLSAGIAPEQDFRDAIAAWPDDVQAWECPARCSKVKRLTICGAPSPEALVTMIGCYSSLEHFHF